MQGQPSYNEQALLRQLAASSETAFRTLFLAYRGRLYTYVAKVYITAMGFMQAVWIGRTKFDEFVAANKVKTIKKDRKIYVPAGEVERYFESRTPG